MERGGERVLILATFATPKKCWRQIVIKKALYHSIYLISLCIHISFAQLVFALFVLCTFLCIPHKEIRYIEGYREFFMTIWRQHFFGAANVARIRIPSPPHSLIFCLLHTHHRVHTYIECDRITINVLTRHARAAYGGIHH